MKNTHFDYIDALRGYAVFAVIVVHVAGALPPTTGSTLRLFEQGARGVQLFYVASALTLLLSWHSRKDGFVPFLIRRVFRVVPMFWLVMPVYILFMGMGPEYFAPLDFSVSGLMRSMFFLDAFYPSNGTIVPGGWTVNTEMVFYALFAIFVLLINSPRKAVIAYLVSIVFVYKFSPVFMEILLRTFTNESPSLIAVWEMFSFPVQMPVFLAGFVVFFLLQDIEVFPTTTRKVILALLIISVCLMIVLPFLPEIVPIYVAYSLPLAIFVFCLGRGGGGILVNKSIIALGKVSYSAYLLHFMILNLIYMLRDKGFDFVGLNLSPNYFRFTILLIIVTLFTYLISYVTFKYIEKPFIKLGGYVVNRLIQPVGDKMISAGRRVHEKNKNCVQ